MRIMFLATYFPRPGNLRMGTWSLDHATALRDAGANIEVVSLTPAIPKVAKYVMPGAASYTDCPADATLNGIQVTYPRWACYPIKQVWPLIAKAPAAFLSAGWRSVRSEINAIVKRTRPDVILANHSLVNGFVAKELSRDTGLPYVTVDHEVGDFANCRSNPRWLKVLTPVVEAAACSVTVSRAMQNEAADVVPTGQFRTIYNGAGFAPCHKDHLERHQDKDRLVIFCCGNLYGRKDIPLLITAFSRLAREFPQAQLRIAGDGPDRESIERLISRLPSKEQIKLLGSIEHSEVQSEMLAADVFALVGWAEPFGVVFLEAMANGCPVVVSEDAGVAEILEHRKSAMFTTPRNEDSVVEALRGLLGDSRLRSTIAQNGHGLYSESCRWTHRANEYLEVLDRATDSSARWGSVK